MRIDAKAAFTALAAALLLATALSTASARILSTSHQNTRVTWSRFEFAASPVTVRCKITLEGSFHSRTVAKVTRTLTGAITRANIDTANCTGGRAIPAPTPWHLTYEGFDGTLPNITSIDHLLARFGFHVEVTIFGFPVTCRYGTATDNLTGRAAVGAGRAITTLNPVAGRNTSTLIEGGFSCPSSGTLIGSAPDGAVTQLNSTARITITLI